MTDVTVTPCAPTAILRLELWAGEPKAALPPVGCSSDTALGRLTWVEPGAWLLRAPLEALDMARLWLEGLCGQDGAVIDITGGLSRFRIQGASWRELLTVNAVFDVEDPGFGPGRVAATILNHAAIWIDVIAADQADVYCLPSYAEDLAQGWAQAIRRMG